MYQNVGQQIKEPFQQTAEELHRLNQAAGRGQLIQQIGQDFPPLSGVPIGTPGWWKPKFELPTGALGAGYGQLNPIEVKRDPQGSIDWPATIGATGGKIATMAAPLFLGAPQEDPTEFLSKGKYSNPGDKLSSSMKPVGMANVDMPAVAHATLPALKESFADLGASPRDFQGREGTLLFKRTVQHAVDLAENRAGQVLDPILGDKADPEMLANSPDLVAYIGKDPDSITNQMVNEARKEANKQLTRSNYFLKPLSKQIAAPEVTVDAFNVGNQARNLLYTTAEGATGYNLRPLRQMESNLITMADQANATHNWLSGKEATYQAAPLTSKLAGQAKAAIAVKTGPLSALSIAEQPGLFSPTRQFNNNMQDIFGNVGPRAADTGMNVRIPGKVSPVQIQYPGLPQNVAGYSSRIPGATPFAPPGYQLGPAPPQTFPQTAIQGTPYPRPPLQLPGGQAPVYVEPQTVPLNRMLPRRGVPATRR
jgi:hypothetical protein